MLFLESPIYHLSSVLKDKNEGLDDFSGPLDLILYLLSKNKMEIKDIQISLILSQYLAWMEARKEIDLEVATEFVTMASHLVDIKTRMLLSIHDVEANNEMAELIASLELHRNKEMYLQAKKISAHLQLQYAHGRNLCVKPPETLSQGESLSLDHHPRDLWRAMQSIASRAEVKKPVELGAFQGIVGREPYPVAKKAVELLNFLLQKGASSFVSILSVCHSRSELVATFIALLDLCKTNRLFVSEDEECIVHYIEGTAVTPSDPSTLSQELSLP
ncbi:MAG: segregation/condensation protein A [Eubacteriales bacterium]